MYRFEFITSISLCGAVRLAMVRTVRSYPAGGQEDCEKHATVLPFRPAFMEGGMVVDEYSSAPYAFAAIVIRLLAGQVVAYAM